MKHSIGLKFALLIILMVLILLLVGSVGLTRLAAINAQAQSLTGLVEEGQLANELSREVQQLRIDLYIGVTSRNAEKTINTAEAHLARIELLSDQLRARVESRGSPIDMRSLSSESSAGIYRTNVNLVLNLIQLEDWQTAALRLNNQFPVIQTQTDNLIQQINSELQQRATTNAATVQQIAVGSRVNLTLLLVLLLVLLVLFFWLMWSNLLRPLRELTSSARAMSEGDLQVRSGIKARRDEVGQLASTFDTMAERLAASHATLNQQVAERTSELEDEREQLQGALMALRKTVAEREQLSTTLQQMQNPVIPVIEGVVVVPLVGQLDGGRLETLEDTVLEQAAQTATQVALLDITGVPVLDTSAAEALARLGGALRLVGVHPILVGVRPEVAETLVSASVDLRNLPTAADLQRGVDLALQLTGRALRRS